MPTNREKSIELPPLDVTKEDAQRASAHEDCWGIAQYLYCRERQLREALASNEKLGARACQEMALKLVAEQRVEALEQALEALADAGPKQTNDCDWWQDDLTEAMRVARAFLAPQEKA